MIRHQVPFLNLAYRIDTERLLRSLMAYLRGEPKVWSVVRVPSVAEEDARLVRRQPSFCSPAAGFPLTLLPEETSSH
jgi:hypothetical protein